MIREFFIVFRLYHKHNPPLYALKSAWRIAVQRIPF